MNNTNKPTPTASAPPILHVVVTDPAKIERMKAEFAAKMKESAKTWPGRKRAKRNRRSAT